MTFFIFIFIIIIIIIILFIFFFILFFYFVICIRNVLVCSLDLTMFMSVAKKTNPDIQLSTNNDQQCGFRTGRTQTDLYKHRKELEA